MTTADSPPQSGGLSAVDKRQILGLALGRERPGCLRIEGGFCRRSLLRGCGGLLRRCGGLLRRCSGLLRRCSSLLRRCSGLLRRCSCLLRRCSGLLRGCSSLGSHSRLLCRCSSRFLGGGFLRSCHHVLLRSVGKERRAPVEGGQQFMATRRNCPPPRMGERRPATTTAKGRLLQNRRGGKVADMVSAQSQLSAPPLWYSMTRVSKKLRSFFKSIISLIHGNGFSSCGNSASRPIWIARRLAI